MRIWYNNILDNTREAVDIRSNRVRIGRNPDNDVVLNSPCVAPEAAVLYGGGNTWELVALGHNGCAIDDRGVKRGSRLAVHNGQNIKLFPFTLMLELPEEVALTPGGAHEARDREMIQLMQGIHLELLTRMDLNVGKDGNREENDEYLLALE